MAAYDEDDMVNYGTVSDERTVRKAVSPVARGNFGKSRSISSEGGSKSRYRKGEIIGRGANGIVYQGMDTHSGGLVAIKEVSVYQKSDYEALKSEVELMSVLSHKHIVAYIGAEQDAKESTLTIIQEWVPGGSIDSLLGKFGGSFPEEVTKRYARDVANGLAYLHEHKVVHRDIKGGNVLVSDGGVAKLADFGTSLMLAGATATSGGQTNLAGTPYFMAPEVMKGETYGRKADIWSFGGLVQQMATGDPPWKCLNFKSVPQLLLHVASARHPPPLDSYAVTPAIMCLLLSCYAIDPSKRPFAHEILKDPILRDESDFEDDGPKKQQQQQQEPPPASTTTARAMQKKNKNNNNNPAPMRRPAAKPQTSPVAPKAKPPPPQPPQRQPSSQNEIDDLAFQTLASQLSDDDDDDDASDDDGAAAALPPRKAFNLTMDDPYAANAADDDEEMVPIEIAYEQGLIDATEYSDRCKRLGTDPDAAFFCSRTR